MSPTRCCIALLWVTCVACVSLVSGGEREVGSIESCDHGEHREQRLGWWILQFVVEQMVPGNLQLVRKEIVFDPEKQLETADGSRLWDLERDHAMCMGS